MSELKDSKFCLDGVINKEKSKVLFAEANGHVVDILLRFLTMPLGKIVRLLDLSHVDRPDIGCVTGLFRDLSDRNYFSVGGGNELLFMGSMSLGSQCRKIIHEFSYDPDEYFCQNSSCPYSGTRNAIAFADLKICFFCQEPLFDGNGGVLMVDAFWSSFVISDDLRISPIGTKSLLTVSNLGITDIDGAEIRRFRFGSDDVSLEIHLFSTFFFLG